MITFTLSLILLVLGYFFYGKFVEHCFSPDDRVTPAVSKADGVDFMVLPGWKVFMIQFLNIAGTGPIFGAIMGIWYGPAAYLWIVLGCIFAGAVHDYFTGMICVRKGGMGIPDIVGAYLGASAKKLMLIFSLVLLILVGAVFVLSPATLLANLLPDQELLSQQLFWVVCIFIYYVLATMLPVDKVIGKIYPLFAFSLLFMAVAIMVKLYGIWPALPEVWDGLGNMGPERLGMKNMDDLFPGLFVTIACGAISGFHATQSPLMARCMENEHQGRKIFYGAMITEGVVALIWASASSWFFFCEGWREVCDPQTIANFTGQTEKTVTQFFSAPVVVKELCNGWLGLFGGILAAFGVIAAPITSGDTALRSCRLIIADALNISQRPIVKRLLVSAPVFLLTIGLLVWQIDNPDSFNVIWKYFGWANQTLAAFMLWTITVYLARNRSVYLIALIPALLMTAVSAAFLCGSHTALGLSREVSLSVAAVAVVASLVAFVSWLAKFRRNGSQANEAE